MENLLIFLVKNNEGDYIKIKYPYGKIYCRILNKTIRIGKDVYPDKNSGFICDCGNWTKDNLKTHDVYCYRDNRL